MASEQDDTVFPEEDLDDDDDELSEDDEEDDDEIEIENDDVINSASPSTSSPAANAVTVALPASSVPNGGLPIATSAIATSMAIVASSSTPSPKRHRGRSRGEKAPSPTHRRLAQAVPAALDRRGRDRAPPGLPRLYDVAGLHAPQRHRFVLRPDQVQAPARLQQEPARREASPFEEEVPHVVGKITAGKDFSFKSPHDQATFEISRKIWSNADNAAGRLAVDDSVFDDEDPNLKNPNFTDEIGEKKPNLTPKSRKRPRSATRSEEKRIPPQTDIKTNNNGNSNTSNLGA
ncbi:hypothetical protein SLA2020_303300 [Shorea laevis]